MQPACYMYRLERIAHSPSAFRRDFRPATCTHKLKVLQDRLALSLDFSVDMRVL